MCGLAGLVIGNKPRNKKDYENIRSKFSSLMVATEIRGQHATGAFVVNSTGIQYHKVALPASEATQTKDWESLMDAITDETVAVIGHVRYATKGDPSENSNNHPIIMNNVIGVHNGVLYNDCELCDKYPYEQEVDSAAIFSAIQYNAKRSRVSTETLKKVLPEIDGNFAVMLVDNRRTDSIFIARDGSRPLVYMKDEENKLLWLSSTGDILRDGLDLPETVSTTMIPAYSIARLSGSHASKREIKYTFWKKVAVIKPVRSVRETFASAMNMEDAIADDYFDQLLASTGLSLGDFAEDYEDAQN